LEEERAAEATGEGARAAATVEKEVGIEAAVREAAMAVVMEVQRGEPKAVEREEAKEREEAAKAAAVAARVAAMATVVAERVAAVAEMEEVWVAVAKATVASALQPGMLAQSLLRRV
jgi:hypothetical protein